MAATRAAGRTPMILQAEAADCGLACLLMVAAAHGLHMDLPAARQRHATSLRGATLADLLRIAGGLRLQARPLRLEPDQLADLPLPCVLHWNLDHFVVLTRLGPRGATVHDPAFGVRTVDAVELSRRFTGVALELAPAPDFERGKVRAALPLRRLLGGLPGLGGAALRVMLLALVLQVFAIALPWQIQWVVDDALVARDADLATVLALGFALVVMAQAAVAAARGWMVARLGVVLRLHLMLRLFRHLMRLPLGWFEKRQVGDVTSRFDSLEQIQGALTSSAVESVVDGLTAGVTLALMAVYSPRLTAVVMLCAACYVGVRLLLFSPVRQASEQYIGRRADQHSHFLETVRGMQSLKLFAAEEERSRAWHHRVVDQFNASLRTQQLLLGGQAAQTLVFGLESVAVVWLGALQVLAQQGFTVGMLFAFVSYKLQFTQRFASLVDKALELRLLSLHAERVGDVLASEPEPPELLRPVAAQPDDSGDASLELRGVRFAYDGQVPVLDDVHLRLAAGESVALVGASGCGKTTLVKLVLGLLRPDEGSIAYGGKDLGRLGIAQWRRQVASVMQDDMLFGGSIADNIAFFDRQRDEARIVECAMLAAVHADIAAMPMQYDTLVGELGSTLSGGQKQRILLARALYRRPRLLVLDEATSHLDVMHERQVNEAIRALRITRLIVAHRPETIASADRVVLLEQGRLQALPAAGARTLRRC